MCEVTKKVFQFSELCDDAKARAVERYRTINVDYDSDWQDYYLDEFRDFLYAVGFNENGVEINYSGFGSQGDGLSFTGSYSYRKEFRKNAHIEFPHLASKCAAELDRLSAIQKKYFYRIAGPVVRRSTRYSHENTVGFRVDPDGWEPKSYAGIEDEMDEIFRGIMQEMYFILEREYFRLMEDEVVIDTIEVNEYEFDEMGEKA